VRLAVAFALVLVATAADAATTCAFDRSGTTWRLTADCTTDSTLVIPDGVTFDGANQTITAIDPAGGHFAGAVIASGGATASIVNTRITTQALADVCDGGPSRLRGIFFDGAAGVIRNNLVADINQGSSRCQEGNAIEVRSLAADAAAVPVEIAQNVITGYQKSGIVVTGSVDVWVHDNEIGASMDQDNLPANAIQVGYGAWARVERNRVAGNSWLGYPATLDAATAILLYHAAPGTVVSGNIIEGNADIAIYIASDGAVVEANEISEDGADLGGYDIGVADYGAGNRVDANHVRGYQVPYDTLAGAAKKTVAMKLK
jgi:hypothetical protein